MVVGLVRRGIQRSGALYPATLFGGDSQLISGTGEWDALEGTAARVVNI
jgi:hypothetical protein